jgi:hypothetical protein
MVATQGTFRRTWRLRWMMLYRDIEYALVRDVERGGWKWSASVAGVVITGEQASKSAAAIEAEKAIDRAVVR